MKNETLDQLTEEARELADSLPVLALDGNCDLHQQYTNDKTGVVELHDIRPLDILTVVTNARRMARNLHEALAKEPRHKTPKRS